VGEVAKIIGVADMHLEQSINFTPVKQRLKGLPSRWNRENSISRRKFSPATR
jgi:hypothetical protein